MRDYYWKKEILIFFLIPLITLLNVEGSWKIVIEKVLMVISFNKSFKI